MQAFEKKLAFATVKGFPNIAPGIVAAAVDSNGEYLYTKCSGYTSTQPDAPEINLDSVFKLMSGTKLITSIAALQCVERGLITLDEPVDKVLPELATKHIITMKQSIEQPESFITHSKIISFTPHSKRGQITLRGLLTHTSGIGYAKWHPTLVEWQSYCQEKPQKMYGHAATEWEQPLVSEPGKKWIYGASHDWVGILISRLNKITLEEYFYHNIFRPLNLTSSTFFLKDKPYLRERLVKTEYRTATSWTNADHLLAEHAIEESGGSGLYSSVADYTAILGDLLRRDPRLLSLQSVNEMFSPQFGDQSSQLTSLYDSHKFYKNLTCGSLEGLDVNFGLGSLLFLNGIPATGAPPGTMAWVGLPNLIWSINRDKGVALMYASQILPPGDRKSTMLATDFQRALWSEILKQ